MATWVLSPISAMKNATRVVPNTPRRVSLASLSSNLSGISVQAAMAMNDNPSTQRRVCGDSSWVSQAPRAPAKPWLARVATRIPSTMGRGLRKRAARMKASSWVLSPISARATMPVEIRNAFMGCPWPERDE